jgi:hypothetical protein
VACSWAFVLEPIDPETTRLLTRMWNSNSVISWLLDRTGLPTDSIHPPTGGRAPGWEAGLVTARRPFQ